MKYILKVLYVLGTIYLGFSVTVYLNDTYNLGILALLVMVGIFYGSSCLYSHLFRGGKSSSNARKTTQRAANTSNTKSAAAQSKKPKKTTGPGTRYTFSDFFHSMMLGVVVGSIVRLGFAALAGFAELGHDSETAGYFRILGNITMLICVVIVTILNIETAREDRLKEERNRATAERLRKDLPNLMADIERGFQFDSQPSMERYARACENLVYCCSYYAFEREPLCSIVEPYRKQCYAVTYPFVDWRNGKYEYIPGTDLGEEISKAMKERSKEINEERERKQRYNSY